MTSIISGQDPFLRELLAQRTLQYSTDSALSPPPNPYYTAMVEAKEGSKILKPLKLQHILLHPKRLSLRKAKRDPPVLYPLQATGIPACSDSDRSSRWPGFNTKSHLHPLFLSQDLSLWRTRNGFLMILPTAFVPKQQTDARQLLNTRI